jgi:hypothetical protein
VHDSEHVFLLPWMFLMPFASGLPCQADMWGLHVPFELSAMEFLIQHKHGHGQSIDPHSMAAGGPVNIGITTSAPGLLPGAFPVPVGLSSGVKLPGAMLPGLAATNCSNANTSYRASHIEAEQQALEEHEVASKTHCL